MEATRAAKNQERVARRSRERAIGAWSQDTETLPEAPGLAVCVACGVELPRKVMLFSDLGDCCAECYYELETVHQAVWHDRLRLTAAVLAGSLAVFALSQIVAPPQSSDPSLMYGDLHPESSLMYGGLRLVELFGCGLAGIAAGIVALQAVGHAREPRPLAVRVGWLAVEGAASLACLAAALLLGVLVVSGS